MVKRPQEVLDMKKSSSEFSKIIVVFSTFMVVVLTSLLFIGSMLDKPMDGFSNVVLASWAELSSINAFYLWKARSENKIKLINTIPSEILEKIEVLRDFFS